MIGPRIVIAALLSALILSPSAAQFASQVVNSVAVGNVTGLGTGVATALGINVGSAGAPVTFNGALGTPSSATLTSATGLPVSTGISGLGTGVATALAVNVGTAGAPLVKGTSVCADLSNGATGCSTATGTSGATIPVLNGNNTFSGSATFQAAVSLSSTLTAGNSIGNANGTNPLCWNSGTGAITFASAACTASDSRLKTNPAPLQGVLPKLMKLGAWRFDWKNPAYGNKRQIGVMADEFETEWPELVSADDSGLRAFDYQKFTAVLFEAIKEQQTQIDELKKKVH